MVSFAQSSIALAIVMAMVSAIPSWGNVTVLPAIGGTGCEKSHLCPNCVHTGPAL